jgi:FixJ family two-component response regulator
VSEQNAAMAAARGTVLVVDDDLAVRKALHRLIQAAGYKVESLADAAAYLARPPTPPPACLVLDIRMPGMNGLELQSAISGTSRALPIVFITGHGGEEMRSQALASGAVEVLFKPLDETTLLGAIEQALLRSRTAAGSAGGNGSTGNH